MATVTDGMYRISLGDSMFLTGAPGAPVADIVLVPDAPDETTRWEIRRTEGSDYTIRHPNTGKYASYEAGVSTTWPPAFVRLSTQQCTWTIADGPEENTVTIGAPGTDLTLGLAPVALNPPRVALSPRYEGEGWTLRLD